MILISILGDFHSSILPIFYEYRYQIKEHILLCDDSKFDASRLNKMLAAQEKFKAQTGLNFTLKSAKINEDDPASATHFINQILAAHDAKNIYLNCTDGLASITLCIAPILISAGGQAIVYDRYANTFNLHSKTGVIKQKLSQKIDIKTHLLLKGYELVSHTKKEDLESRKKTILKLTKNLKNYKKFANDYQKNSPKTDNNYLDMLTKCGVFDDKFITGGVFEEYIYHLVAQNIPCDDLMTGAVVRGSDGVRNELDLLIMRGHHLSAIECKFTDKIKIADYIHKINSVASYLDDDGRAMLLCVGRKRLKNRMQVGLGEVFLWMSDEFSEADFIADLKGWIA